MFGYISLLKLLIKSLRSKEKISSVAKFWDLLQGARVVQSYEFTPMHAQFLLYRPCYNGYGHTRRFIPLFPFETTGQNAVVCDGSSCSYTTLL